MLKQRRLARSAFAACLAGIAAMSVPFCSTLAKAQSQSGAKSPVVSVHLRAKETTVKARDPILIECTITNRSNHEVTIGRDVYRPGCAVDVLDASGNFAKDKRLGYLHGRVDLAQLARMSPEEVAKSGLLTGKLAWIELKPGESFTGRWDVGDVYDLTGSGQYRITADFVDPESGVLISSNTVDVTISK